jgi:predicted naringenin-chalcone synthase
MNQELTKSLGMIATITERVPKTAIDAILPIFDHLTADSTPADFDWAIHPGGAAILQGAQRSLNLSDDHIRASLKVYRSHGNSSSPTVLIVLDELRRMEKGRDNVVATSFGPGMTIEMCMMKRCRTGDLVPRSRSKLRRSHHFSVVLPVQFVRLRRWYAALTALVE